ncbi:prenylated Rab acceptor protein 1-like isoform X2 [Limulus polyphemus]|nr:prenylated Rab acceptor protein 1-like isoform X2 [Limulus polyphemus]XP_022242246.1 prenylated Rab acceptor protein 1-like isoform X2 [Limulus polyphemus]
MKKGMALSSSSREWLQKTRENIQPWNSFFDMRKLKMPSSMSQSTKRVVKNIEQFQSNYFFVFIVLILYCLLTSPLLLIAVAVSLGACYIISLRNAEHRFHIFGHELTLAQQYGIVSVISFPLFYMAGAGSAVFWVLGASFFFIMLHAIFYSVERNEEVFDLQIETV